MKINLQSLLDGDIYKIDFEETLDLEKVKIDERELKLVKPISVNGEIYKTDEGLYLNGNVTYEYLEHCSRCLKEFSNRVNTKLSGKLVEKSKDLIHEEDDEQYTIYYDGKEINIEESVVDSIYLSLPMKSLCSKNCKGLCPKCGKNLNEGQCNCVIDNIDPRLVKLKELLD